jgi:hypothetical protein
MNSNRSSSLGGEKGRIEKNTRVSNEARVSCEGYLPA